MLNMLDPPIRPCLDVFQHGISHHPRESPSLALPAGSAATKKENNGTGAYVPFLPAVCACRCDAVSPLAAAADGSVEINGLPPHQIRTALFTSQKVFQKNSQKVLQ